MTISKKLYLGFGAILAIMLLLFMINIFTVAREYNARSASAATLSDVQTIETIRYQMMENRQTGPPVARHSTSTTFACGSTSSAKRRSKVAA